MVSCSGPSLAAAIVPPASGLTVCDQSSNLPLATAAIASCMTAAQKPKHLAHDSLSSTFLTLFLPDLAPTRILRSQHRPDAGKNEMSIMANAQIPQASSAQDTTEQDGSSTVIELLHCPENTALSDVPIPQQAGRCLCSAIEALNGGTADDAVDQVLHVSCDEVRAFLDAQTLGRNTVMLTAITAGLPSKCVFQIQGGRIMFERDVSAWSSSSDIYLHVGSTGPFWLGTDGQYLVIRSFDCWTDVRPIVGSATDQHIRVGGHLLRLAEYHGLEIWDATRMTWISMLPHHGIKGFAPTRYPGVLVTHSGVTTLIWRLNNECAAEPLIGQYTIPPGDDEILSVREIGGILAIEIARRADWDGEEMPMFQRFEYRDLHGEAVELPFAPALRDHKYWATMDHSKGTRWCAFSDGTHVVGVDGKFTIFGREGQAQGSFELGSCHVDTYLDRFIIAVTHKELIILSQEAKVLLSRPREQPDVDFDCIVDIRGRVLLLYPDGGPPLETFSFLSRTCGEPSAEEFTT